MDNGPSQTSRYEAGNDHETRGRQGRREADRNHEREVVEPNSGVRYTGQKAFQQRGGHETFS
jgi:hypothetical protein